MLRQLHTHSMMRSGGDRGEWRRSGKILRATREGERTRHHQGEPLGLLSLLLLPKVGVRERRGLC